MCTAATKADSKSAKESDSELLLRIKALQLEVATQQRERQQVQASVEKVQKEKQQVLADLARVSERAAKGGCHTNSQRGRLKVGATPTLREGS